jgi:hypothetical protein
MEAICPLKCRALSKLLDRKPRREHSSTGVGAKACVEGEMRCKVIRERTGTKNIIEGITEHQKNWKEHVEKKTTESLPQPAYNYNPMGRHT